MAVFTYRPTEAAGHLELRPGERLVVCQQSNCANWLYGNKEGEKHCGVFPAMFVERVSCEDECGEKTAAIIRSLLRQHRNSWLQAREYDTDQEAQEVRQDTRKRIFSLSDLRRARFRCLRSLTRKPQSDSDNQPGNQIQTTVARVDLPQLLMS